MCFVLLFNFGKGSKGHIYFTKLPHALTTLVPAHAHATAMQHNSTRWMQQRYNSNASSIVRGPNCPSAWWCRSSIQHRGCWPLAALQFANSPFRAPAEHTHILWAPQPYLSNISGIVKQQPSHTPCKQPPLPPLGQRNPNNSAEHLGGLIFQQNSFPAAWILVPGPKHTFLLVAV